MSGEITVVGWEAANVIARQLLENGYEVKIETDGAPEDGEFQFVVSFVHPHWDHQFFEIVDLEELEATRTWEDIKKELGDSEVKMEECEECKVGGKGKGK